MLNLRGLNENLSQNSTFSKNGRMSCLSDPALIPRREPLDEGVNARPRAPRGLRFL